MFCGRFALNLSNIMNNDAKKVDVQLVHIATKVQLYYIQVLPDDFLSISPQNSSTARAVLASL